MLSPSLTFFPFLSDLFSLRAFLAGSPLESPTGVFKDLKPCWRNDNKQLLWRVLARKQLFVIVFLWRLYFVKKSMGFWKIWLQILLRTVFFGWFSGHIFSHTYQHMFWSANKSRTLFLIKARQWSSDPRGDCKRPCFISAERTHLRALAILVTL